MIYTLTFNPALDYIIGVSDYKEGQVNRTDKEKILPGGKGINVSTVLKNLGIKNTALGFVAGFTGKRIVEMLDELGVDSDFIFLENGFSRINVKIKADKETEINGKGPVINQKALEMLYSKLNTLGEKDVLVLAGSVPASLSKTVYCDIMELLQNKNIRFVVDATDDLLVNVLKFSPFLIKPNNFELEEISGRKLTNDTEVAGAAKELQKKGAKNVLVSLGGNGALMVTENGEVLKVKAPDGKVINTTGAGDSMVAGFLAGYLEKADYTHAVKMGVCAGSASAFSTELAAKEDVMHLYDSLERG